MWELIAPHVDFNGKSVLDLGCGDGDFMILSKFFGAKHVYGLDIQEESVRNCESRVNDRRSCKVQKKDIEKITWPQADICFLFSVIPYLQDPDMVIRRMGAHSEISLIECQYKGDGPESGWTSGLQPPINDDDMADWFSWVGFTDFTPLGFTEVNGRDVRRTIWLCKS
jgi:SAM-dependent methyltransferase